MKARFIKPMIASAATLALLCSCGGSNKISFKDFVKEFKNKTNWVVYDNCKFTGSYTDMSTTPQIVCNNFEINCIYDSLNGYTISSQTGGSSSIAISALSLFKYDVSFPGLIYAYGITLYDDKGLDNIGRFLETKKNPYSLKGSLFGSYYDVEYDNNGMPNRFRYEYNCSGTDAVADFTITHTGGEHSVIVN